MKKIFVTVGTTKFDELIGLFNTIEFLDYVYSCGYTELIVQHGKSTFQGRHDKLEIKSFDYDSSLSSYYTQADLVISSGGSGTILECLEAQKDLIVCINTTLQDNHQIELSKKLSEEGYLCFCNVSELKNVLLLKRKRKVWKRVEISIVCTIISQYTH